MATQLDPKEFDLQEQLARIRKMQVESDKFSAETRKLLVETKTISSATIFQGFIAVAALLARGRRLPNYSSPDRFRVQLAF